MITINYYCNYCFNNLIHLLDIGNVNVRMGDNPWSMAADPETYGKVFVGTLGRGVYFGSVN